jgi:hypothetical protein
MLAIIEDEPLRYSLIREDKQVIATGTIVHELVNPLIYLRLECFKGDLLGIRYGFEGQPGYNGYDAMTASFIRMVYKLTMDNNTSINIEDCVKADYVMTECSELYEYIEERGNKHHRFELIKYKPKTIKRKLRRVA